MTDIRVPLIRSPGRITLETSAGIESATGNGVFQANVERLRLLFGDLHAAIEDLQTQQRQSLHELQQVAVELAAAAASWLTMAAIDRNQFNVEQLIGESIEQLGGNSPVTVRLSLRPMSCSHNCSRQTMSACRCRPMCRSSVIPLWHAGAAPQHPTGSHS